MSITHHLPLARTVATALLTSSLMFGITGCSDDESTAKSDPNVDKTDSYMVEYIPGAMDPTQGKYEFQIQLTDIASETAVTGESVTLMPLMYMTDKTHSTPVDGPCTESATAGTYDCTIFYVMADTMNGSSTGHWEIEVMIGGMTGESAMFYPSVGMAMGGTTMAKLKHSDVTMMMMGNAKVRTFHIFKSDLTGMTGNHTFEMFTSTMETMMSFPAVYNGAILNAGDTMNELTISNMTVAVSTTSTFDVIYDATEDGNGYWTAAGIEGLTDGTETMLYVRLTIDGNTFNNSIDGVVVPDTTEEFATFTVTPGSMM